MNDFTDKWSRRPCKIGTIPCLVWVHGKDKDKDKVEVGQRIRIREQERGRWRKVTVDRLLDNSDYFFASQ